MPRSNESRADDGKAGRYSSLFGQFLDRTIDVEAFVHRFLELWRADQDAGKFLELRRADRDAGKVVDQVMTSVDCYRADPSQPGDIGEDELRRGVRAAQSKLPRSR